MKENKRCIMVDGRKTSVNLEGAFWTELKAIARFEGVTISKLITTIAATSNYSNLSSATRVFVIEYLQNKRKSTGSPHSGRTTGSSEESRSAPAWRGFARRG